MSESIIAIIIPRVPFHIQVDPVLNEYFFKSYPQNGLELQLITFLSLAICLLSAVLTMDNNP